MSAEHLVSDEERQAAAVLREQIRAVDDPAEVRVHEDETRENKTPGFSRMRTEWLGEDAAHIRSLRAIVDGRILVLFSEAFVTMNMLYDIVREPLIDPVTSEIVLDANGFPVWARSESGAFVEDYSRLGIREREDLLFRITTNLFEWQQTRADLWGDAMFAKAQWEEAMAGGFLTTPGSRPTVDDKTHFARRRATDERYFAIFQTLLSRKADAVVDSMTLLGQRLKDVLG